MSLSNNNIQFQKLSDKAYLPTRAHENDAGYDMYSAETVAIPARSTKLVKTNICARLPDPPMPGTSVYARIAERSGLAMKKSIVIGGGVVDLGYRGDIGVVMHNLSENDFYVNTGDRIAQLIVTVCLCAEVQEVDDISSEVTERSAGGFGSSGI